MLIIICILISVCLGNRYDASITIPLGKSWDENVPISCCPPSAASGSVYLDPDVFNPVSFYMPSVLDCGGTPTGDMWFNFSITETFDVCSNATMVHSNGRGTYKKEVAIFADNGAGQRYWLVDLLGRTDCNTIMSEQPGCNHTGATLTQRALFHFSIIELQKSRKH